jgi:uncharacterized protein
MESRTDELKRLLSLMPHPEGGWFAEHHRAVALVRQDALEGDRAASTSIYYLLEEGDASRPHRIRSDETWHFYEGAPLVLREEDPAGSRTTTLLAPPPLGAYVRTVPAGHWMGARSTGKYSLVGCSVALGFEFDDLEFLEPTGPQRGIRTVQW